MSQTGIEGEVSADKELRPCAAFLHKGHVTGAVVIIPHFISERFISLPDYSRSTSGSDRMLSDHSFSSNTVLYSIILLYFM